MSALMDSNIDIVYVRLLNEGTVVLRPTLGKKIFGSVFLLIEPVDYDPEDEEWEFLPGSTVNCEYQKQKNGENLLVAKSIY